MFATKYMNFFTSVMYVIDGVRYAYSNLQCMAL